ILTSVPIHRIIVQISNKPSDTFPRHPFGEFQKRILWQSDKPYFSERMVAGEGSSRCGRWKLSPFPIHPCPTEARNPIHHLDLIWQKPACHAAVVSLSCHSGPLSNGRNIPRWISHRDTSLIGVCLLYFDSNLILIAKG
ncbi:hypothetical protein AVEN_44697-1, partial [Araneus ventricosus]